MLLTTLFFSLDRAEYEYCVFSNNHYPNSTGKSFNTQNENHKTHVEKENKYKKFYFVFFTCIHI